MKRSGPERVLKCLFNLDKGPSDDWFSKFHKRHPNLKWGVPQPLDVCRIGQSSQKIIDHFFNLYGMYKQ